MSETKAEVEAVLSTGGKHEHAHEQLHACIGVSLVLGFVFMLLVDQIGSSHVHSAEGPSGHCGDSSMVSSSLLTSPLFLCSRSRVGEGGFLKNHHHPGAGGPRGRWDTHCLTAL